MVWDGAAAPGDPVTVLGVDGPRRYTVVGVLAPVRFERALFFTDAEAARRSPRVDALVLAVTVDYPTTLFELQDDGVALVRHQARVVDRPTLPDLPVLAGSLDALRDDTIVVDRDWGRRVGDTVGVWGAGGSPVTLRVVAVVRDGVAGNGAFLTGRHPKSPLAEQIRVRIRPGADPAEVAAAVRRATAGLGAEVVPAGVRPAAEGAVKLVGIRVVLGVALLYAGLSIAGTMLMAARDRAQDFELLRLAGATVGQVTRVVALLTSLLPTVRALRTRVDPTALSGPGG